jgi:GTPase SAR1 family protein
MRHFSRPFPFAQLCVVGEGRAGKTALANSISGRAFKPTESTIGVGVEHLQVAQPHVKSAPTDWSLEHSSRRAVSLAEEQLAWAVVDHLDGKTSGAHGSVADILRPCAPDIKHNQCSTLSIEPLSPNELPKSPASRLETPLSPHLDGQLENIGSLPDVCPHDDDAANHTPQHLPCHARATAPAVKLDKDSALRRSTEPETLRIKLMDFGGQKAFYSLHHLYLTRHGVYLLVFNMQWLVGSCAWQMSSSHDGVSKRDSALGFLSFWLNSIYLHAKSPDGSVAPIVLIGTHKDAIRSALEHEAISSLIYEKFKASPAFGSVVPFKHGTSSSGMALLWFYPVDNTLGGGDATIELIKSAVYEKLQHEEYLKRAVPLPWLQLYDALQSTKLLHMPLAQVEVAAQQFGFPVTQSSLAAEVQCMLKFFTESGLLMHHNCSSLRDVVVLDVIGCLVTPASIVMCQHDIHMLECHELARATQNEAYMRLATEGVLCDVLLDALWCDYAGMKREIVELMMFYGLMVPVLEDLDVTLSQYLVPSLLPKLSNSDSLHDVHAHCYFLLGMKTLISKWEKIGNVSAAAVAAHGFCPAGLFARLTGRIVSKCQSVYNFFGSQYGASEVRACFGSHVFVIRELPGLNAIQLLVMVDNPRKLVSEMSQLLQSVISEMIPSLGFCAAVMSDCLTAAAACLTAAAAPIFKLAVFPALILLP